MGASKGGNLPFECHVTSAVGSCLVSRGLFKNKPEFVNLPSYLDSGNLHILVFCLFLVFF